MTARAAPKQGRLVAVRLTDIPRYVRVDAARRFRAEAAADGDWIKSLDLALRVEHAAEHPSSEVYYVPADAVARVLGRSAIASPS